MWERRCGSRGRQRESGGVDGTTSVAGEPVALVLVAEAVEQKLKLEVVLRISLKMWR